MLPHKHAPARHEPECCQLGGVPPPTTSLQVCVAVLLDNFVNASARDEERAQLRKIEEAKSFKVGGSRGIQPE